jgi:hypothetical protein
MHNNNNNTIKISRISFISCFDGWRLKRTESNGMAIDNDDQEWEQ